MRYKSLKMTFETWQALTRLTALTGETRTRVIERLVKDELAKANVATNVAELPSSGDIPRPDAE